MSIRTTAAPRRTSENTLVAVMFFAAGIVFLDRFGIANLFPQIGAELHLDNSQLAALISVTALTWAISSLLFSIISDRLGGRKKVIIVSSLILFSLAVGLVGTAQSFGTMLALRALIGFCEGPALPLIQGAVAAASSSHRRGRNLGLVIAGTSVLGSALAPTIMIGLASAFGWRAAFPIVAIPGAVIAVLVIVFYHEDRSADSGIARLTVRQFGRVLVNRNFLLALLATTMGVFVAVGYPTFQTLFLSGAGYSGVELTLVLTAGGVAGAIGTVLTPTLSDRIGRRPALFISGVSAGLTPLVTIVFVHTFAGLLIGAVVAAFNGAIAISMYTIPAESLAPETIATGMALQIAIGETLGGVLGPQVGGAVADATHSVGAGLVVYAVAPILILIAAILLKETAPRRGGRAAAVPELGSVGATTNVPTV